jgi:predicted metal-dependent hydrolase
MTTAAFVGSPSQSPTFDAVGRPAGPNPAKQAASRSRIRARERRVPRVRAPEFDFSRVPRYWVAGSPFLTHVANGVNLLFPAGERFFIRSVKHYLERIDDETLRAQVRGFFGQEGRHARSHELYFDALRAQGYDVDGFLRWYERVAYGLIEPLAPAPLRLAVTAALEHYTALLAEGALTDPQFERHLDPTMQRLLRWHACEEIEHKAVAFDVLEQVAPGYPLRVAGMVVATLVLAGFWTSATAHLLAQDLRARRRPAPDHDEWRALRERKRSIVRDTFLRGLRAYLRPDFHPDDRNDRGLAESWLRDAGFAVDDTAPIAAE